MWPRRSHMLQAWTKLMSNGVKTIWTSIEQEMFDEIKRILAKDILLVYPNFNKWFDIHTDARNYQLGSEVIQEGKTISFYIQKPTCNKTRYIITENELLFIAETLNKFRTILDLFQPKTSTFSTRALIWVHSKTVHYFSQPILCLFLYLKEA